MDLAEGDSTTDPEGVADPENYIDILDVLDGRADANVEEASAGDTPARSQPVAVGEEEEEEVEEGQEEEEEQGSVLSVDEDVNPNALEGLEKFVSSLETSRKRKGDSTNSSLPRKRRVLEERTAAGVEGEFATMTSSTYILYVSDTLCLILLDQQLRLDDLLAPLASHSSAVLSLKKSVKALDPSRTRGAPLSAPLPQRTQERLDREAAYEQTKDEVDKWKDTMQQIKEVVFLPLVSPWLTFRPKGRASIFPVASRTHWKGVQS